MVGLPGQTLRSVQETAGFVQALRPSALSAKVFKEYPGLALPSGASLPSPGEVEEQEGVLSEAQQAIDRENHRTPPHWRVMAERLVSRLVAVTKKG
jgi:hypothetical protein